ncbi:MAG: thiazole synthase, partial [Endozoicomonas sp.]
MLKIADKTFNSRLFTGTGKFRNSETMTSAIKASDSELVTMALKRVDLDTQDDDILSPLIEQKEINLLPNTSGARNAEEAVYAAQLAR